jgi:hypothetical protein
MPAQRAVLGGNGLPEVEWFFVENEGKLIAFTIHDPATLQTMSEVLESLSFGSAAGG